VNRRVDVDIPKPGIPDSGDITEKGTQIGGWFAERPEAFWTLVIVGVAAWILLTLMKRPFVRGLAVGAVILTVVFLAFFN
jgi:hypothetical protein